MYVDNLDVLISKYTGHLIIYNVLQHVVILNSKLYSKMTYLMWQNVGAVSEKCR